VLELAFAVTSRPVGAHNDDRLVEGEGRGEGVRAGGWVGGSCTFVEIQRLSPGRGNKKPQILQVDKAPK